MSESNTSDRTIPTKFRKLPAKERVDLLRATKIVNDAQANLLQGEGFTLNTEQADGMAENVIGVFGLPEGLAINFLINGKSYAVPMVVEEPSVIAALSYAALLAQKAGGYLAQGAESILTGQIQLINCPDLAKAQANIEAEAENILALANDFMPRMHARGGGAVGIDTHIHTGEHTGAEMLVVHIHVDTRDAMGANAVNTLCEQLAPQVERITGGEVLLRILSNLTDQAIARAEVCLPPACLATEKYPGEQVRDRIVLANDFALADPYRAATHNKGIMNGIDAVAIATGNDWRALEAGAHAYAAKSGRYRALTQWRVDDKGNLHGEIELPIKVGILGASLQANPAVAVNHAILDVVSAKELSGVIAAVGLAQNFSALRALVTAGIQHGHMKLHARSVAASAGASAQQLDEVAKQLVARGEIKISTAKEIIAQLGKQGG